MTYKKLFLTILLLPLIFSFSFAQSSSKKFVYVKNASGELKNVVVYDDSIWNNYFKINAYCLSLSFQGFSCEQLPDNSPLASDPNNSVKLVVQPRQDLGWVNNAINVLTGRLDNLQKNQGNNQANQNTYPAEQAAVPARLEGTDRNPVTTTAGDQTTGNKPVPQAPSLPPQFTGSGVTIAEVEAAINRALANLPQSQPQPTVAQPVPTSVTPSQVVSNFFNNAAGGAANYVGFGGGSNNSPKEAAIFQSLTTGDGNFSVAYGRRSSDEGTREITVTCGKGLEDGSFFGRVVRTSSETYVVGSTTCSIVEEVGYYLGRSNAGWNWLCHCWLWL
jgi:hypothetical protein